MYDSIFLSLGTNEGDRAANLEKARTSISALGNIISLSSTYETEAWGKNDQPAFYNQVMEISTKLDPASLLSAILAIEIKLGRIREERWGPRIIDIDVLFYGAVIMDIKDLTLPHPGIPGRRFILLPMNEIASQFVHPALRKNISTLLSECVDNLKVEKVVS